MNIFNFLGKHLQKIFTFFYKEKAISLLDKILQKLPQIIESKNADKQSKERNPKCFRFEY